jgi:hypothetical protein
VRECLTQMVPSLRALLSSSWDPAIRRIRRAAKAGRPKPSSSRIRFAETSGEPILGAMVEERGNAAEPMAGGGDGGGGDGGGGDGGGGDGGG